MLPPVLLAVSACVASAAGLGFPLHASCRVDWKFGVSCAEAKQAIIEQMKAWSGPEGCENGGEKCLYAYLSAEGTVVRGSHTTPVSHYVDDLEFNFADAPDGSCAVHGYSTSETFYAVFDMGTNYCNLRNLVTGSGLDRSEEFSERTGDSVCTQHSLADCDVY